MKDPFWALLGLALFAYIVVYFLVISGNNTKAMQKVRSLDFQIKELEKLANDPELPGQPMIDFLKDKRAKLVEEYTKITQFYIAKDANFETLFTDVAVENANEEPDSAKFKSVLDDHQNKVKMELTKASGDPKKPLLVRDGDPAKFEDAIRFPKRGDLKKLQKSWWMFAQVLDLCKKHGVSTIHQWKWEDEVGEDVIVGRTAFTSKDSTDGQPNMEKVFGYNTLSMQVSLDLPYEFVALFLEDLLATTDNSKVLFGLNEFRIQKEPYDKKVKGPRVDEIYWEQSSLKEQDERSFQAVLERVQKEQELAGKPVKVHLELFAYDFFERTEPLKK
jgi:hypothetical protein